MLVHMATTDTFIENPHINDALRAACVCNTLKLEGPTLQARWATKVLHKEDFHFFRARLLELNPQRIWTQSPQLSIACTTK